MRFFSSLVRPDESTGAVMRWVHRIWVFFWLTALGAGIGLLSLYLTAHSYAAIDATALLQSYFKIPLLVVMNLLAPVLLVYLGFFLFARPWAAYLLSALLRVALQILPHCTDFLAGATTAVEHAAAIFRAAVNSEGKIPAAVFASAHHDLFLDALAQRKIDQIVHALRIQDLRKLLLIYKLERNLHWLEVKFLQRWSLLIRLHSNRKVHVGDTCVQNCLEQAQNLLLHGRKVAWDVRQFFVRQQLRRIFAIRRRLLQLVAPIQPQVEKIRMLVLEIIQKFLYWLQALCVPCLVKLYQRALRFMETRFPLIHVIIYERQQTVRKRAVCYFCDILGVAFFALQCFCTVQKIKFALKIRHDCTSK